MLEPPDDFLPVTELSYHHDFEQGVHGKYFWIQSRHVTLDDFFEMAPLPAGGVRFIITTFDGHALGPLTISPLLHSWEWHYSGSGDSALVVHPRTEITDVAENVTKFMEMDPVFDLSSKSEVTANFWKELEILSPIAYISAHDHLIVATKNREFFESFIFSPEFLRYEEIRKHRALEHRVKAWNDYHQDLGPECGPEKCIEPNCMRLRIKLAVKCIRHQLEQFSPELFGA